MKGCRWMEGLSILFTYLPSSGYFHGLTRINSKGNSQSLFEVQQSYLVISGKKEGIYVLL